MASLELCLADGFYDSLQLKTERFVTSLNDHINDKGYPAHMAHIGSIFWIAFSKDRVVSANQIEPKSMELFKKLHAYLLDHAIYLGPSGYEVGFISAAHSSSILDQAVEVICDGLDHTFGGV